MTRARALTGASGILFVLATCLAQYAITHPLETGGLVAITVAMALYPVACVALAVR